MSRYLMKGEPVFVQIDAADTCVCDRVDDDLTDSILDFCDDQRAVVVPESCRPFMRELVERAREQDQPWYRILTLQNAGDVVACLGFGQEAGRDRVYHF